MGRVEKEIVTSNTALRDLVEWLRGCRTRAGLTYRELAERTGLHATTLQRVASGDSVPRLMSVLAYARGCDALAEDARGRWQLARREYVRSSRNSGSRPAPAPALVGDLAELSAALRDLYEEAGAPSLRVMEERAGAFGALPRSSAHRIVNKQAVPRDLQQFQAFLRACEVPARKWKSWESAWSRVWRAEKQETEVRFDGGTMSAGPLHFRPLVPHQRPDRSSAHDLEMLPLDRTLVSARSAFANRVRKKSLPKRGIRSVLPYGAAEPTLFTWPDEQT